MAWPRAMAQAEFEIVKISRMVGCVLVGLGEKVPREKNTDKTLLEGLN